MFKKVVATLSTVFLAGGIIAGTAHAEPIADAQVQVKFKAVNLLNNQEVSANELNQWINSFLSNYDLDINKLLQQYGIDAEKLMAQKEKQEAAAPAEEAKQPTEETTEEVKQPAEQAPAAEQPAEETTQTEQPAEKAPQAEQPAEEAAPQQEAQPAEEQASQPEQAPAEEQQAEQAEESADNTAAAEGLSEFEQQVVDLTNQERQKAGLQPLQADTELSKVARAKSQDMADNNYFDHNSPTYGSPFDMMKSFGISYQTAGENIAKGQQTPEQVVQAWMNSEGHRANILKADFTHIGVGYVENGNIWTQQFIGK